MKKYVLMIFVVLAMSFLTVANAQAASIHVHYFESYDFHLVDESFQIFSVSPLQGESVTIVSYGAVDGVIPGITVIGPDGVTVIENLNPDGAEVAFVEFTASVNGFYTFLVSRQTNVTGPVRVMVFEGEPLSEDETLLDTADPLLPNRAFLVAAGEVQPLDLKVEVVEDEGSPAPPIYAARANDEDVAPLDERQTAVRERTWTNDSGRRFYTVNISTRAETLAQPKLDDLGASQDPFTTRRQQQFLPGDFLLTVGGGSETPTRVDRLICTFNGFEIVGTFNGNYQVVDPFSVSGFRLIPFSEINVDLNDADCGRVREVFVEIAAVQITEFECPAPGVIDAQRELIEGILEEYIAVRAYKDATLNELGRQNAAYYALRATLLQSLIERTILIQERQAILAQGALSPDDVLRLIEIEDRLFELNILLEAANENIQEQLRLVSILWEPVIDLIAGISVERNERYTQRILEVRRGDGEAALDLAAQILAEMLACADDAVPGNIPPRPSGIGN